MGASSTDDNISDLGLYCIGYVGCGLEWDRGIRRSDDFGEYLRAVTSQKFRDLNERMKQQLLPSLLNVRE